MKTNRWRLLVPLLVLPVMAWYAYQSAFHLPHGTGAGMITVLTPDPIPKILGFEISRALIGASGPGGRGARGKVCNANLRTIEGSIQLLCMDAPDTLPPIPPPDQSGDFKISVDSPLGKPLLDGRYLKQIPACPSGGIYTARQKAPADPAKTQSLETVCSVHGSIDMPFVPVDEVKFSAPGMLAVPAMSFDAIACWFLGFAFLWFSATLHLVSAIFPVAAARNPESAVDSLAPAALRWSLLPLVAPWFILRNFSDILTLDARPGLVSYLRSWAGDSTPVSKPREGSGDAGLMVLAGRQIMVLSLIPCPLVLFGIIAFPVSLASFFIILPWYSIKAAKQAVACSSPAKTWYGRQELISLVMLGVFGLLVTGLTRLIGLGFFSIIAILLASYFGTLLALSVIPAFMIHRGLWNPNSAVLDGLSSVSICMGLAGLISMGSRRFEPIAVTNMMNCACLAAIGWRSWKWGKEIRSGRCEVDRPRGYERAVSMAVVSVSILVLNFGAILILGFQMNLMTAILGLWLILAMQFLFARDFPPRPKGEDTANPDGAASAGGASEPGYGGFRLPDGWAPAGVSKAEREGGPSGKSTFLLALILSSGLLTLLLLNRPAFAEEASGTAGVPVTFIVEAPPGTPGDATIFIAGNHPELGSWDPGAIAASPCATAAASRLYFRHTFRARPGTALKFKFSKGSWATVERNSAGRDVPDRMIRVSRGLNIHRFTIASWAATGPEHCRLKNSKSRGLASLDNPAENSDRQNEDLSEPVNTLTGNFATLEIPWPGLPTPRRVLVRLPCPEADLPAGLPLLIALDGVNCFDAATSFAGVEWGIDETVAMLEDTGRTAPLVVAAVSSAGAARITEYTWCPDPDHPDGGGADGHLDFILNGVLPALRQRFSTSTAPTDNAIMGSSLGGIFVLHALLSRPGIFGLGAAVSPSLWWNGGEMLRRLETENLSCRRLWLDTGSLEGENPEKTMAFLKKAGSLLDSWKRPEACPPGAGPRRVGPSPEVHWEIIEGARHDEGSWADRVGRIMEFLFPHRQVDQGNATH